MTVLGKLREASKSKAPCTGKAFGRECILVNDAYDCMECREIIFEDLACELDAEFGVMEDDCAECMLETPRPTCDDCVHREEPIATSPCSMCPRWPLMTDHYEKALTAKDKLIEETAKWMRDYSSASIEMCRIRATAHVKSIYEERDKDGC